MSKEETKKQKSPCCRVDILEYPEYGLKVCSYCKTQIKPINQEL